MACKSWKETIAAYRFLNNDNVTHDTILSSHRSSTFERIKQENIVLIPQDTTEIDFCGRQTIRKTLTMDNGKEFVGHVAYRLTGFKTFFCDPYRPRQKALVEKMNSMIHRILPKNTDITTVTQKQLDNVAGILNNMPRKIFGYKTPNELWAENL
jgi:IS30 family transposase